MANETALDLLYRVLVSSSGTAGLTGSQTAIDLIYRKLVEISGTAGATNGTALDLIVRKLVEISGVAASGGTFLDIVSNQIEALTGLTIGATEAQTGPYGLGLLRGTIGGGGAPSFTPSSLFSSGEKGFWYEPGKLLDTTDTAGTTPAVVTDTIGRAFDHSPNAAHATQATGGSRPTLKSSGGKLYYEFDGTADTIRSSAVDLSGTAKATIVFAATIRSMAVNQFYWGTTNLVTTANVGAMALAVDTGGFGIRALLGGPSAVRTTTTGTTGAQSIYGPQTVVFMIEVDLTATDEITLNWNGNDFTRIKGSDSGAAALSSQTFNLGSRSGTDRFSPIDVFGYMLIGRALTTQEKSDLNTYWASRVSWPYADSFDIWLVGGDSNANGAGDTLDTGVDISNGYYLAPDMTGFNNVNVLLSAIDPISGSTKVGPGVAFVRTREAAEPTARKTLLVHAPWGGSGHSDGHWVVGGDFYLRFLLLANNGLASRFGNVLRGIIWASGTNDTGFAGDPVFTGAQWTTAMVDMVAGFRSTLPAATALPIVVAPMVPAFVTDGGAGYLDIQNAILALPGSIAHCAAIDPAGLGLAPQSGMELYHFNAASQRILGAQFYSKFLTL